MNSVLLPHVSIIIIVLNGAQTISACLQSIFNLDYPQESFEVIVVDNGSTDNTVERINHYEVKLIYEGKRGYAFARNAGIRAASGEIIAFTDADCIVTENWLTDLIAPYSDPEVGLTGGSIIAFPSINPTMVERFITQSGFIKAPSEYMNGIVAYFTTANVTYRKRYLDAINGLNPNLPSCSDVDLSRRIQLLVGAKAIIVPPAVVYHRNRDSITGLIELMKRNGYGEILMATIWKDYPPFTTNLSHEFSKLFRQILSLFIYIGAYFKHSALFIFKNGESYDSFYLAKPLLWFLADFFNILGKLHAIINTRFMTVIPIKNIKKKENL